MTWEDKELLLKDLCARLPYGVLSGCYYGEDIKPYLFPLLSMTEEQKEELKDLISQQTKILIEQLKNYYN